ncbi:MAG: hypothetical protein PUB18_03405 [bacterium]|nr:hypothetical protein [bacterium]
MIYDSGMSLLAYLHFKKVNNIFIGLLDFSNQWQNSSMDKKRIYNLKECSRIKDSEKIVEVYKAFGLHNDII